jgi:hypothetical protein
MRVAALALALLVPFARGDDLAARAARSYALEPRGPGRVAVGARGSVTVAIRCEPGVHVQRQAPLRATASAPPPIAVAKARLGWEDARDAADGRGVELPVSFTASGPGAAEVRVRVEFFVCSDAWCVRQDREVVVPVEVRFEVDGPAPADGRR